MTAVIVRVVLAVLCGVGGARLLMIAVARRRAWRSCEAGLDRAQAWWDRTHGGPFDQARGGVPEDIAAYVGPSGPRTELREPAPALAHLVWGWLLLILGVLLALSALAQVASGTS